MTGSNKQTAPLTDLSQYDRSPGCRPSTICKLAVFPQQWQEPLSLLIALPSVLWADNSSRPVQLMPRPTVMSNALQNDWVRNSNFEHLHVGGLWAVR